MKAAMSAPRKAALAPWCQTYAGLPGSLPRVIRVLMHYYAEPDHEPRHVYLGAARALRRDLDSAQ